MFHRLPFSMWIVVVVCTTAWAVGSVGILRIEGPSISLIWLFAVQFMVLNAVFLRSTWSTRLLAVTFTLGGGLGTVAALGAAVAVPFWQWSVEFQLFAGCSVVLFCCGLRFVRWDFEIARDRFPTEEHGGTL